MDITEAILTDHFLQRLAFARLDDVDPADTATLTALWTQLATFLEAHAAAEELVFYPELLQIARDTKDETKDAIKDHNELRDAIADAAEQSVGSPAWWKAVNKARTENTEHMGEEEDGPLRDFRRGATLALRHDLGVRFEAAKSPVQRATLDENDKDPAEYVEEHTK